jgi:hypothetical protein
MSVSDNMAIVNSFKCNVCGKPAFSTNIIGELMTDEDKDTIIKVMSGYKCDECKQKSKRKPFNHIIGDSSVPGFRGKDAMMNLNLSFGSIKKVNKSKVRKSNKKVEKSIKKAKKSKVRKSNKKVKKSVKRTRVRRN